MSTPLKIFKIDHRVFWSIFIVAQVFLLSVMIGTLSSPNWVELDPPSVAYSFKGSITKVQSGLTSVPDIFNPVVFFDLQGSSYEKIGCSACFVRDQLNQTTTPVQTWNFYHSWCALFGRLWFAAGLFICFEVAALVSVAILIVFLGLFITYRFYLKSSFCAGGCLWISHIIAILGWIGMANVTFGNDCNSLNNGTSPPTVCAKEAPRLALFTLVFLPLVMVPFFVTTCSLKRKLLLQNLKTESEVNESNISKPTEMRESKENKMIPLTE